MMPSPMQKAWLLIVAMAMYNGLLMASHSLSFSFLFPNVVDTGKGTPMIMMTMSELIPLPVQTWQEIDAIVSNDDKDQQRRRRRLGASMTTTTTAKKNSTGKTSSTKNNNTTASSSSSSTTILDTDQFGWTPEVFPNPYFHPTECGIANISLSFNLTMEDQLLCDPDGIFTKAGKVEILEALRNFSMTFLPHRSRRQLAQQQKSSLGKSIGSWWNGLLDGITGTNSTPPTVANMSNPPYTAGVAVIESVSMGLGMYRKKCGEERSRSCRMGQARSINVYFYIHLYVVVDDDDDTNTHQNCFYHCHHDCCPFLRFIPSLFSPHPLQIDLPAVLQQGYYYTYQDQSQMINDAAQIFSHTVHQNWWTAVNAACLRDGRSDDCPTGAYGTLIFLSVKDLVCFISTGSQTSTLLPWWRLGNVVWSMKTDLMNKYYARGIIAGITELVKMLQSGPPSLKSRVRDFFSRFGVVLGFAIITCLFGAWGEYRDRRKRWRFAEDRSTMNHVEREKAKRLQMDFKTRACPICLEPFYENDEDDDNTDSTARQNRRHRRRRPRVDNYGIVLRGTDDKPIKILRCGHIFDHTCWKQWVNSGQGNPCICPVCRQDVGRPKPSQEDTTTNTTNTDRTSGENTTGRSNGTSSYSDIPLFGRSRFLALHFPRRTGAFRRADARYRRNRNNHEDDEEEEEATTTAGREAHETDRLLAPSATTPTDPLSNPSV